MECGHDRCGPSVRITRSRSSGPIRRLILAHTRPDTASTSRGPLEPSRIVSRVQRPAGSFRAQVSARTNGTLRLAPLCAFLRGG